MTTLLLENVRVGLTAKDAKAENVGTRVVSTSSEHINDGNRKLMLNERMRGEIVEVHVGPPDLWQTFDSEVGAVHCALSLMA